jgi:SOS-response transcriptional repressor LexA
MDARRRAEVERRAMERLEEFARSPKMHARLREMARSENKHTAEEAARLLARLEREGYLDIDPTGPL